MISQHARCRLLSIMTVAIMLIPSLVLLSSGVKADDLSDMHMVGHTYCPSSIGGAVVGAWGSQSQTQGNSNIRFDSATTILSTGLETHYMYLSGYHSTYVSTNAPIYYESDADKKPLNPWNVTFPNDGNNTVVTISIKMFTENDLKNGNLSFVYTNGTQAPQNQYPWLDQWYHRILWQNKTIGERLSEDRPYTTIIGAKFRTVHHIVHYYEFDISDYVANLPNQKWNASIVMSDHLLIMFSKLMNPNTQFTIDYLGLDYTWLSDGNIPTNYQPPTSFDQVATMYGLIWLLIVFLPGILLAQPIPKIGFTAGTVLMLIILGASQNGFAFVSLIGFISIGVFIYKEGGG